MTHFRPLIFLYIFLFLALLTALGFFATFGIEEGTLEPTLFWSVFEKGFFLLRFPSHTLFEILFLKGGWPLYLGGLVFNCLFYAFLSERIFSFFKEKRMNDRLH